MSSILTHRWGESRPVDRVWSHVAEMRPSAAGKRSFLVLQAYIDDSSQEGGCFVLAGYISTAERWAAFSREWERLLPKYGVLSEDGVYHFKMQEMARNEERLARVPTFERVIYEHALAEFSWGLRLSDVSDTLERIVVPGIEVGFQQAVTPFYFAFFALVEQYSAWLEQSGQNIIKEPIDLIFDQASEKKLIIANWLDYTEIRGSIQRVFSSTPRFEDDKDFLPLQAADYLAWQVRQEMQGKSDRSDRGKPYKNVNFLSVRHEIAQEELIAMFLRILRSKPPYYFVCDAKGIIPPEFLNDEVETN